MMTYDHAGGTKRPTLVIAANNPTAPVFVTYQNRVATNFAITALDGQRLPNRPGALTHRTKRTVRFATNHNTISSKSLASPRHAP